MQNRAKIIAILRTFIKPPTYKTFAELIYRTQVTVSFRMCAGVRCHTSPSAKSQEFLYRTRQSKDLTFNLLPVTGLCG